MAAFRPGPETFLVEELPAYAPSGSGFHTFVWIEKRDLTTAEAVRRLARALAVAPRDVGHAGLKDRHATTRQWLSVPEVPPETALAARADGVQVLAAHRHEHKLRVGHNRGNQFALTLEAVSDDDVRAIEAELRRLARDGLPNRFGAQRFGARGDNVAVALAVLRGEQRVRDRRERDFLLSALQSAVFNQVLDRRTRADTVRRVLDGDVLKKTDTGGLFSSDDLAGDQARLDAGAVIVTGPLPGNKTIAPPPDSAAAALEDEAGAAVGLTPDRIAALGRALPGARRPLLVPVTLGTPAVERAGPDRLTLRFALPSGSYATELVEALGVPPVLRLPDPS